MMRLHMTIQTATQKISHIARSAVRRWLKMIDIKCPNCGRQIDPHSGHINNGRVCICEKGKPLKREVRYYCRHCDSTIIFLKKCEPEGVGNDR